MKIPLLFDIDAWQEIFGTLKRNKLRSVLTGFSVAWGIFMVVILLGAGNGLKNGVTQNFNDQTKNITTLYPGSTTLPYEGYSQNRYIELTKTDLNFVSNYLPNVEKTTAVIQQYNSIISYKNQTANYSVQGVSPVFKETQNLKILSGGRFINESDEYNKRKVAVLDKKISSTLFKTDDPIGKYVNINNISFQIVGILESSQGFWGTSAYIPFSTASILQNPRNYNRILFFTNGLTTEKQIEDYNKNLRLQLAKIHNYSPKDEGGIYVWNRMEGFLQTIRIFGAINLFIWLIGISTLAAGIVGVGNIMLITVKERTKEIGIKKAIGAKNRSILSSIILESIIVTTLFGYIGMLIGIGITELVGFLITQLSKGSDQGVQIFSNPTVDMKIVMAATLVLIISGILAGYFPARKALKIKPVEALRYE